ncbi:MAG: hypothetical protein V2A64_02515 [Candidatus Omnitrophota bacterium]
MEIKSNIQNGSWLVELAGDCVYQFPAINDEVIEKIKGVIEGLPVSEVYAKGGSVEKFPTLKKITARGNLDTIFSKVVGGIKTNEQFAKNFIRELRDKGWSYYKFGLTYNSEETKDILVIFLFLCHSDIEHGRILIGEFVSRISDEEYAYWKAEE